jgi:hypothetical protein
MTSVSSEYSPQVLSQAGKGAGATGGPLLRGSPLIAPAPPFGLAFAGWQCMASMVDEVSPGIADVMRNAGLLVRAAIEEHADRIADVAAESLSDVAFSRHAAEVVRAELSSGLLPITKEFAARLVAESIEDLDDDERRFLQVGPAPTESFAHGVLPESLTSEGATGVGGPPTFVEAVAALVAGALRPDWSDPSGLLMDPLTEIPQWWVTAALELRDSLSAELSSVYCVAPVHKRGDKIEVQEITYTGRQITGLENPKVTGGAIVDKYGVDVKQERAPGFFETVDAELRNFCYVARITDKHANRAAREIGKLLQDRGDAIVAAVGTSIDLAKPAALAVAAAHGAPPQLIEPLLGLLSGMATGLVEKIRQALVRAFADVILAPWLLTHTVALPVVGSSRVKPVSIWLLESGGSEEWLLASAQRDANDPAQLYELTDNYAHHVGFNYRGRVQIGASRSLSEQSPAGLVAKVATERRPAVWVEPLREGAGFHALLPHSNPNGGMYVTAIRSEIRYTLPSESQTPP